MRALGSCATATAATYSRAAAAAATAATTATAPATRLLPIIIIIMLVVVVRNEDNHHDGHRRRGPPRAPKRLKRPKSGIIGSGRSARLRAHPQNRVESGKIGFLRVESGIIGSGRSARTLKISLKRHLVAKSPFGPQTAVLSQGILGEFGGGLGAGFWPGLAVWLGWGARPAKMGSRVGK